MRRPADRDNLSNGMRYAELLRHVRRAPFRAFRVTFDSGESVAVRRPERVAHTPQWIAVVHRGGVVVSEPGKVRRIEYLRSNGAKAG